MSAPRPALAALRAQIEALEGFAFRDGLLERDGLPWLERCPEGDLLRRADVLALIDAQAEDDTGKQAHTEG